MNTPKLSSLTPTDKIKLAAELRGIVCKENPASSWGYSLYDASGVCIGTAWSKEEFCWAEYCELCKDATSYDAIIPLIQKQDLSTIIAIQCYVCRTLDCTLVATPSQLLDALLVATGKAEL
jgi:hypothetical protein